MSNTFTNAAKKIENSAWVIPIFLLFCYGLYLGIMFFLEDYNANLMAYTTIPTRKAVTGMIENMARFIQIAPILFGFVFLRDTNKRIYGLLSAVFLITDWVIGVYYRGWGLEPGWLAFSALEDFVFFTAGSEILIVLSFGMVAALLKPVWSVINSFLFQGGKNPPIKNYPVNRPEPFNLDDIVRSTTEQKDLRPKLPNEGQKEVAKKIENYIFRQFGRTKSIPGAREIEKNCGVSVSYAQEIREKWIRENKSLMEKK